MSVISVLLLFNFTNLRVEVVHQQEGGGSEKPHGLLHSKRNAEGHWEAGD